jgi:NADH-quinone oxidoreductase subunit C
MTREELASYLSSTFGDRLTLLDTGRYDPIFAVAPEHLTEVARALRDDENVRFDYLCNIAGVDTGEHFEMVYSLASVSKQLRVDVKVVLPYDKAEIDSVIDIWPGANWFEREIWELYGITIRNHPNLTRFLLPDDWDQGFPLRKDWDAPDFIRLPEELQ